MTATTTWLIGHCADPRARVRLLCFSYADGGVTIFSRWKTSRSVEIDHCAVQLPGRQSGLADPPIGRLDELTDVVKDGLSGLDDPPRALLFGHSFGALVAYEPTRGRERWARPVHHLFVAACSAPQPPPKEPILHALAEPELLREMNRHGNDPLGLLDLVLPTLCADLTAYETYDGRATTPLNCLITAFAGSAEPRLPLDDLVAWQAQTTGMFLLHTMAGGHFLLDEHRAELLGTIERELRPWMI